MNQVGAKAFQILRHEFSQIIDSDKEKEITFLKDHDNFCVGLIDIIDSTKITGKMSYKQVSQYYTTFLNTMTSLVKRNHGRVVKCIGDCILFYFPKNYTAKKDLFDALKCGIEMISCNDMLNEKMHEYKLPKIKYRISMDYGSIMLAKSASLLSEDIFGSTVNICSKINHFATADRMVVGQDLYQVAKSLSGFNFKLVQYYSAGQKFQYPVYQVRN